MIKTEHNVNTIREAFKEALKKEEYVIDKTGALMLEIVGASFIADEASIFGKPDEDYIKREIQWYESQSCYVSDIPGKTPAIWRAVSSSKGKIHSNYGYLTMSMANHSQFEHCLAQLIADENTRRALMIYTRPSMQTDYKVDGMSDFICTNAVQYIIRDSKLYTIVQMRSNDVVYGYKNDYAWQRYMRNKLMDAYNRSVDSDDEIEAGDIIWQAGSLHVYEKHFDFVK